MKLRKYLKNCNAVYHTTLDPRNSNAIRIHLVPPRKPKAGTPWVVILNGYSVLPLQTGWAILLKEFMEVLNETKGNSLTDEDIDLMVGKTIIQVKKVFPHTENVVLKEDLGQIISTLKDIALGEEPDENIGYMTLAKYAKYMRAPHRMDLMISPMEKKGVWNCNQKCLHCYAANEKMSNVEELTTEQWKKVIDSCRKACIPALTFTGGEATLREDLVELIDYAQWFVTRLNTNGILLTQELCEQLSKASLDSVQVTLYSYDPSIHNTLVGGNHFEQTIRGIKNAIAAGLDVSINTPLCSLNNEYVKTIEFAQSLGIKYFSCSGLIPTGNARASTSVITRLTSQDITKIVEEATTYCQKEELDLSFTSPGWIESSILKKLNLVVPSCGACLSNMAIAPNGDVIPCQSWLGGKTLGNLLQNSWKEIWQNPICKDIRLKAVRNQEICLLKEDSK